jgi:hypothetical protein
MDAMNMNGSATVAVAREGSPLIILRHDTQLSRPFFSLSPLLCVQILHFDGGTSGCESSGDSKDLLPRHSLLVLLL